MSSYTAPVDKLLTYGEPEVIEAKDWPDYLANGIGIEHIPDILHMLVDPELRTTNSDEEDPKYWTPIHAWRALGQLHDASVIAPILDQTEDLINGEPGFGEWALEELPEVFEMIGPASISTSASYLADLAQTEDVHTTAISGLTRIANKYPETREEIIRILSKQLEQFEENNETINAYLIESLGQLKAVETLPLIKEAFEADKVDDFFISLEDVEIMFGLKERSPAPSEGAFARLLRESSQALPPAPASQAETRVRSGNTLAPGKRKSTKMTKKKMAKISRKKNHAKKKK